MSKGNGLIWMGGLFGIGLLAVGSTSRGRQTMEVAVSEGIDWIKRIVDRTSKHEGTYDSLNLNSDNAGLSFGRLQWAQRTKALGNLLNEMHMADPGRFEAIFGSSWRALIEVTRQGSLEPVDGAVLWTEPWVTRFRTAGRESVFQAVQDRLASGGEYMAAAIAAAKTLGITTERAISITYDTSVQQGPGTAKLHAQTVREKLQGQSVPTQDVLRRYIQQAAAPFRSSSDPGQHKKHPHLEWRPVGTEWHVFAGKFDLYKNIINRRTGLLNDRDLSDQPIHV